MSSSLPNPWLSTVRLSLANQMAYKTNFILLVIAPALVFFLVKFNLWSSLYTLSGKDTIQGYSKVDMLQYQAYVLLVSILAQGYSNIALAEDIRLGRISSFLLYPFSFWKFHASSFIAFQLVQLLIAGVTLLTIVGTGLVQAPEVGNCLQGLVLCILSATVWFVIQFSMGLLAFWLEETWVLRVMFLITASFLSGSFLPLEFFPEAMREVLIWLPFPYLTYEPVRAFMGTLDSFGHACAAIGLWIVILGLGAGLIWNRGLRLYSAAGM